MKLHFRACAPGASDFFRDCHDNPIIDLPAALASFGCTSDEDGNCAFDKVPAGDHTITWDGDPALLVYCSDASDRSVNLWDPVTETVPYTEGADITCDIFILDPDLVPRTPQPTPTAVTVTYLPNTGSGDGSGGAIGILLAMALALLTVLGSLGLAARRARIEQG